MNEQKSLIEVERALPTELPSKFDAFLIKAKEISEETGSIVETAQQFVIDSEAAFQLADTIQAGLKKKSKDLNDERLAITRPVDDFKQQFIDTAKPAIDNFAVAISTYQRKMADWLNAHEEDRKRVQAEGEKLLEQMRESEPDPAVAALIPTSIAPAPAPKAVASDVGEPWEVKEFTNMSDFLRWLADHPEWHSLVRHPKTRKLHFPVGEMNRMARQFRDVVPVPGVKFHKTFAFRSKAK